MKLHFWTRAVLSASLFLAFTALAGEDVYEEKMMIKLKTGDAEMIEADVSDLAIGESETFVTDSGRTVDLLRTAGGMEIYVDGELLEMDLHEDSLHEKHVIVHGDHEVECFSETEGDCDHNVFVLSGDDDIYAADGDVRIISKKVEVVCDEDEQCEEMVWISDGDDVDFEELHEDGEAHKVIKIRKHKATSGQD